MKNTITKAAAALAIGILAATSSANAGQYMGDVKSDTSSFAQNTWRVTKNVASTIVRSPVIVYQAARGERPLFTRRSDMRPTRSRDQMALTGHPADQKRMNESAGTKIQPAP
jgi:hypothetical protein